MLFIKSNIQDKIIKVNPYDKSVTLSVFKDAAKMKNNIWIANEISSDSKNIFISI